MISYHGNLLSIQSVSIFNFLKAHYYEKIISKSFIFARIGNPKCMKYHDLCTKHAFWIWRSFFYSGNRYFRHRYSSMRQTYWRHQEFHQSITWYTCIDRISHPTLGRISDGDRSWRWCKIQKRIQDSPTSRYWIDLYRSFSVGGQCDLLVIMSNLSIKILFSWQKKEALIGVFF